MILSSPLAADQNTDAVDGTNVVDAVDGIDILTLDDQTTIRFDTREVPSLTRWVRDELMPVCEVWYPKISAMLASEDFSAPSDFSITFRESMRGVAYTSGKNVVAAGPWYIRNRDGEAIGSIVHELVHVVQQYGSAKGNRPPGWLIEGIADQIRWYQFEPIEKRRSLDWDRSDYDDPYFPAATFLHHIITTMDPNALQKINAMCREGRYRKDVWQQWYGKTADQIWQDARTQSEAAQIAPR